MHVPDLLFNLFSNIRSKVNNVLAKLHLEDGSFQKYAVSYANHLSIIPDGLPLDQAAPILCGGVTVYKALKEVYNDPEINIGERSMLFWRRAVREPLHIMLAQCWQRYLR